VDEGELADDIEQADRYKQQIYTVMCPLTGQSPRPLDPRVIELPRVATLYRLMLLQAFYFQN
jgi:hypothetical protein